MRLDNGDFGGEVAVHGHWGRPVLCFPAEAGHAADWAANGMVDAVTDLIEAGRVKLYCVDSADQYTWSDRSADLEERARRHGIYERWLTDTVLPWIAGDSGGRTDFLAAGCSLGAYHAVNLALRRADLVGQAIALSGTYDPSQWHGWGERADEAYFHNPTDYVGNLSGGHLEWLRAHVHVVLVVGQGAFEESPTRALSGTHRLADLLQDKGIPHELDVWGHDVPHDWSSWQRQLAHHLPRFC